MQHQKFFDMLEGWRKVATAVNKLKSKATQNNGYTQSKTNDIYTTRLKCRRHGAQTLVRRVIPAHADKVTNKFNQNL